MREIEINLELAIQEGTNQHGVIIYEPVGTKDMTATGGQPGHKRDRNRP